MSDTTDIATHGTQLQRGPFVRWGAIVWGVIVCAIAVGTLLIVGSPDGLAGFARWMGHVTAATAWLLVILVLGGIMLVLGLLALIRRSRRPQHPPIG